MTLKCILLILFLGALIFVHFSNSPPTVSSYNEVDHDQAIAEARQTMLNCYEAAVKAEKSGANITELTVRLNRAENLFSKALLARKNEDYDLAAKLANDCIQELDGFIDRANELSANTANSRFWDFICNIVGSSIATIAIICIGFAAWSILKKRYSKGRLKVNPKKYGTIFLILVFTLALLAASPALSRLLVYPRTEFFTEFWVLDSNHETENYPFNISSSQNYNLYLGVKNYLGYCAYYMIKVKFRNQTQPAPESFGSIEKRAPSSLPSLFNLTAFIADKDDYEIPLTFSFDYTHNKPLSRVEFSGLKLNDMWANMSDCIISWDKDKRAFRGFLFFELWLYNNAVNDFQYHGRFVGLWLNMTVS